MVILLMLLQSCGKTYFEIPAGYVGKIQTETGFTGEWLPTGSVPLGIAKADGRVNKLIIIEITSSSPKEVFPFGNLICL